jgi:nucleotide-binding universal stress UspA family protein
MTETGEHTGNRPSEVHAVASASEARRPRPFERALCAVDGTKPSFAAVRQAAELVGAQGHLTLLAIAATRGGGKFRSAALGSLRAGRVIERASQIAESGGVPFTPVVDPGGPPSKVIAERAADHDLLVLGAPSRSAFGTFGGSVAVETLRTFTTPLLLARVSAGRPLAETIVVASDGCEGSDALLELAVRLARPECRRIVLVHAQGSESNAHPHRVLGQKALLERSCGDRARTTIEPSDACELIEQVVDAENATLAVLGSRRAGGVGAMLGSVSRRAVRTLRCSVLVIPRESRT